MIIISSAEMGPGTFEAKFVPLSKCDYISQIWVLRKTPGPDIDKVEYILVPKFFHGKVLGLLARSLMLVWYSIKLRTDLILAYHFIPHAFFAFFASLITQKPFIIGQTGLYIQRDFSRKKMLALFIKQIIKAASYLNVPGQNSIDFWVKNNVSNEKLNILHSTIDTNYFKPNNSLSKKYDFIVLSRLVKEKRVDIIVELLSQLKKKGYTFKTVIVGDGNEINTLKKQVKDENLDDFVEFVGFQKDTRKWFYQAKFYLMFSESEGLPTSLMQAMSCGLVPIVTDVGNISDLVDEKVGFIHKFLDKAGYLKSLEFVLFVLNNNDFEKYSLLCRARIVQNHSYQSAHEKWNKILKTL
ncbi:MAG: glycosyltransferase [bacterium]